MSATPEDNTWATGIFGLGLQAVLVATAITVFGMIAAYFQNLDEHQFSLFQLLPQMLMLWLGSAAVLFGLAWLAGLALPSARYWLIPFIGVVLWAQGAFNVPDYGPLDGAALDWPAFQHVREIALLIIAGGIFLLLRHPLRNHVFTVIGAVFAVQLVYALGAIMVTDEPMPRTEGAERKIHRLSETENTFLIILDAFQSDIFGDILQRRPELAEQLPGFVFFPNTVGTHPTTYGALPSYFLGRPYRNEEPFREFLHQVFTPESILADFSTAGYQVDLIRRAGLPAQAPMTHIDHLVSGGAIESSSRDRLEESLNLFEFTAFRHAPQIIRRYIYYHGIWTLSRFAYLGQPASSPHRADLVLLRNLEQNAYVEGEAPVFRLIHFATPHLPVVFDDQLRARTRPFNRETFTDQAESGLTMALRFLETLKAKGVYENSRILIAADHGQPGTGVHGSLPDMPAGAQHPDVNSEAARVMASGLPLLLTKDHGDTSEFRISRAPAHTLDIAPTLVDGLAARPEFEGVSLFSDSPDSTRERHFYYYDWGKHGWGAQFLDPIRVHHVTGHAWDANAWSGEVTLLRPDEPVAEETPTERPDYTPGQMLDLRSGGNGRPYAGEGWSDPERERHWSTGEAAEIILPGQFETGRAYTLQMSVQPFLASGLHEQQRLKVEVNGEVLARFELEHPRRQQLSVTIPAGQVREDTFRIMLITPDHASPAMLGSGSDERSLGISLTHLVVK